MHSRPSALRISPFVRRLTVLALVAATIAALSPVLRNDWILLDDPLYVYENPHVNRGITAEGIRWCFRGPHGGNWHPITSLSHMVDVQLFGLAPRGHHTMSLALHAANAVFILLVLARMTGAWWRSACVASLFALHPLRVESVAWVSERKDLLCASFFLLALGAHQLARERPTRVRKAAVIGFTALALLSKPMAVTLPFVILLLELYPLTPTVRSARPALGALLARTWLLFALAAASAVITFVVQRSSGALVSTELVPLGHRIANAFSSYWRYIDQTFRPVDLTVFYPFPRGLEPIKAGFAAIGLGLATWLVLAQRRRPHLTAGWLWYVGMLVPVIGLVQVGGQAHADRYTYLPSVGLLVAIVWASAEIVAPWFAARAALGAVVILALAFLSVMSARQAARWRDTRTLFTHALSVTRDNPVAHLCLGDVLLREGRVDEAIPHFRESIRLAPKLPEPYNKLGSALGAKERHEEAIALFRQGLALAQTAELHHNLGFALMRLSRLEEAISEFEAALRRDPDHMLSLVHLGVAVRAQGQLDESARLLRRAVGLQPQDVEARRSLAVTLVLSRRIEEAIEEYGALLQVEPADLDALVNIAWIRATHAESARRNAAVAVEMAERARAASADTVAVIEATVAAAYAESGRYPEAVTAGERAVALALQSGDADAAARYAEQLDHYRQGRPYHFAD